MNRIKSQRLTVGSSPYPYFPVLIWRSAHPATVLQKTTVKFLSSLDGAHNSGYLILHMQERSAKLVLRWFRA
jgi:hypothetical protein